MARPNDHARPGLPTMRRKVLRSAGQRRHYQWLRGCFTTRAETRFVSSFAETRFRAPWRCSSLVSNHRWQPHEETSFDRKAEQPRRAVAKAELDQDGASRHDARPAGAASPTRAIAAEVRSKWCGDELFPTRSSKSPGSCLDGFAP
jgi:hypothetical protein